MSVSIFVLYCVPFQLQAIEYSSWYILWCTQEDAVALRKEGSGVVLDCQLPHLIGIDEDLLSTGIVLYYLKVNLNFI